MEDVVYATEVTMVSALSVSALSAVTSAGGASAGGSGSVAVSSPATFWGFVEVLQIINYMVYLAVDNPYILKELFRKLAIVNGDFMPDLFGYFVEGTGINPPSRFTEEGLSSNIFLNAGSFIQMFAINWISLGVFIVLSKMLPKINYFWEKRTNLALAIPLRIAVEGFLDLSCACAL